MTESFQYSLRVLTGLLLALAPLGSASPEAWGAPYGNNYQGPSQPVADLRPADSAPLWGAVLDAPHVSAQDGTTFFFVDDGLMALEVASGNISWRRPQTPAGSLLSMSEGLFVATGDTVLRLDPRTGDTLWQRQLGNQEIRSLTPQGGRILAMGSMWQGGDLLDAGSGELIYSFAITDNAWPVYLDNSLLYIREYSGEPHFYHAVLHDLENAEQRWWLGHSDGPIRRPGGLAWFVRQHLSPRGLQDIRVVDESSGQVVETWQYSSGAANVRLSDFAPHWFMTEEHVAVLSGAQDMVLGFPWGGASEPAWTVRLGGAYRIGPVDGWLFAEAHDGRLIATSLPDGNSRDLLKPGPAFTRIETIGTDVYAAREDGTLYGIDPASGNVFMRPQLGVRITGPILIEADHLVLQSGQALWVFGCSATLRAGRFTAPPPGTPAASCRSSDSAYDRSAPAW